MQPLVMIFLCSSYVIHFVFFSLYFSSLNLTALIILYYGYRPGSRVLILLIFYFKSS